MMTPGSLLELLDRLKASPRIRGIFTAGSTATDLNPSSDLDVAVVLDRNPEGLRSVFTTIGGRFADLFVFDVPFVERLRDAADAPGDPWDDVFAARLLEGRIEYDPDGVLESLRARLSASPRPTVSGDARRREHWSKINYDLVTNRRYFASPDPVYRRALEIRLLYGIMDTAVAYFLFRNLPWRGEKEAWTYFDKHDPAFGAILTEGLRAGSVGGRMGAYLKLIGVAWHGPYQPWPEDFLVPTNVEGRHAPALAEFWIRLTEGSS